MSEEMKMKIMHPPGPDPQRGWSRKGLETTSKLRKENAVGAPVGKGDLLDEKVSSASLNQQPGKHLYI